MSWYDSARRRKAVLIGALRAESLHINEKRLDFQRENCSIDHAFACLQKVTAKNICRPLLVKITKLSVESEKPRCLPLHGRERIAHRRDG